VLPYIRRALGPAQLQAERGRLELTRPIGPAVFGTASSSSRVRSKIRWGGLEPPPRGPHPRALPGELRTWDGVRGSRAEGGRRPTSLGIRDTLARLAPGPCRSAITPKWGSRPASNRRPPAYEAGALSL
jgi:hypothetical protein